MNGFRLTFGSITPVEWKLCPEKDTVIRSIEIGMMSLVQQTTNQFLKDKLWLDNEQHFVATEGILYNRDEILSSMLYIPPVGWRGTFAMVYYDKCRNICRIYNDHVGSRMLFWTQRDGITYLSSDIFDLIHVTGFHSPNSDFVNEILQEGFSMKAHTMVKGIQRLLAGQVLEIDSNGARVDTYYRFDNKPLYFNEVEILKEIEKRFTQAVNRVLDKNREYGLRNVFPLSGGLDSRMAQVVARKLTKAPIQNYTYSQSGHYDHLLPEKIASYLGNSWQYIPLDGGNYLAEIDSVVQRSQMLINYNGPSEINYCINQVDWTDCGVVLTGVNGDSIFSTVTDSKHTMEDLYGQCFSGNGLGSPLFFQYVTDSQSPFMDVDVLEYILHVPHRLRWNNYLYDRWIIRYHPEATQWHHKYEKIGHRHWAISLRKRKVFIHEIPTLAWYWLLKRLGIRSGLRSLSGKSMNPYDGWVISNPDLRKALDRYYDTHLNLLDMIPDLRIKCEEMYRNGTVYQQCKVLTILSALSFLR